MTFQTRVRLNGRTFNLEEIRCDPDRFITTLARARADRTAECLCTDPPLRLVTRCRSGSYNLARWPRTQHADGCAFSNPDPDTSDTSHRVHPAIREDVTGLTAIRFSEPLAPAHHGSQVADTIRPSAAKGVSRASIGLLSLLLWLWEQSELNSWTAGRWRSWSAVTEAVRTCARTCTINGQPGSRVLYVVPPYAPGSVAAYEAFLASLAGGPATRGFVLGELKAQHPTAHGLRYELEGQRTRQVFVREQLHQRLHHSYPKVFAGAGSDAGGRKIMLALVERSSRGYTIALDAAVMLTDQAWVPADSSYEIRASTELRRARRSFVKPLRFLREDAVFPDYILTDEHAAMEVWGDETRSGYEARKRDKQQLYRDRSMRLIEWTVTEPMPDLLLPH